MLFLNANILKDWLNNLLDREVAGGGFIHFADWFVERKKFLFDELCAEFRNEKGQWEKRSQRNEAVALLYCCRGLILKLNCERINWKSPPSFARSWDKNPLVIDPEENKETPKKKQSSLSDMGSSLL